jgi:hypothetical protein
MQTKALVKPQAALTHLRPSRRALPCKYQEKYILAYFKNAELKAIFAPSDSSRQ